MSSLKPAGVCLLLFAAVGVTGGWYFSAGVPQPDAPSSGVAGHEGSGTEAGPVNEPPEASANGSPFTTVHDEGGEQVGVLGKQAGNAAVPGAVAGVAREALEPALEVTVGRAGWSDSELRDLVGQLRANPELFDRMLAEFEQAGDPDRLRRLAMLLGRAGGEGLTQVATRMAYSDDRNARHAGLDVLGRVQASDPAARAVVVDLLAAETDDELLVDTLNALAVPPRTAPTNADDGALVPQVLALTGHLSASVRGSTIAILSRWADDATLTPVLEQGLLDEDSRVRGASVFAVANGPPVSATMRQNLFAIAENPDESREVRSGALLSLQTDQLDEPERQRLQEALDGFNTRRVQP